jgi:hypothetical protein
MGSCDLNWSFSMGSQLPWRIYTLHSHVKDSLRSSVTTK